MQRYGDIFCVYVCVCDLGIVIFKYNDLEFENIYRA